jgi:autotransporter-associated beta strand protein
MKSWILLAVAMACATPALADTFVWCGPATGSKMTNANVWSNVVTGAKATIGNKAGSGSNVIVFDCSALGVDEIDVEGPNDGWNLGELRILNGVVNISSLYKQSRYINFCNLTNELYIADGATLVVTNGLSFAGPLNGEVGYATLVKTGGGMLKTGGNTRIGGAVGNATYTLLHTFLFKEGEISYGAGGDSICLAVEFRIGAGQSLALGNDKVQNDTVVHVEKGGTLSMANDLLGAIVGDGDVTISGIIKMNMPTSKSPFVFGGTMAGRVQMQSVDSGNYLLTSSNAFAGVSFTATAVDGDPVIQFAPGVGTFYVGQYTPAAGQPLHLEDTDGNAVTVYAGVPSASSALTTGSGDLFETGSSGYTFSNGALAHTGWLGVLNGYGNLTLGTGADGGDIDLSQLAGFYTKTTSNAITFKNHSPYEITGAVTGNGYLHLQGAPIVFDDFRMSNGGLVLATNVVLRAPSARLAEINVKTNGELLVEGGSLRGVDESKSINLFGTSETRLVVSNAVLHSNRNSVRNMTFKDGSFWRVAGSLDNTGTEAEPQNIYFDDATLWFGTRGFAAFDSYIGTASNSSRVRNVYVKEGGLRCDMRSTSYWTGSSLGAFLSGAAGGADGGVEVRGHGWLRIDGNWSALSGPVRVLGTMFQPNAADFELRGDVELGSARFGYASARIDHLLASGSGKKVTVSGGATIYVNRPTATTASTFVLGPADAGMDESLVRVPGGVLFLMDINASSSVFAPSYEGTRSVFVNGGLSSSELGIAKLPVFAYTKKRADGDATDRYCVQFVRHSADDGFVEVYGTPWADIAEHSSTDVALVDSSSATSISSSSPVGALRVFGRNGNAIDIASGVTLTVGHGGDPACLILNNTHASGRGKAVIGGSGTIDFGAREGVIVVNEMQSGSIPAEINCHIAGTGGVTFASPSIERGVLKLGGSNSYSGGTRIVGGMIYAANTGCFGSGEVMAGRSVFYGGGVYFTTSGTWSNDFTVQGCGDGYLDDSMGVLAFHSTDVVLSGNVTLEDEAHFVTDGVNYKGTFSGVVSGEGDLYLRGPGTVAFAGVNTYRGATTVNGGTLAFKGAGTPGDGPIALNDATLRFENSSDIVVTNAISGTGRIVAAGAGSVKLLDAKGFSGDFVVEGNGAYDLNGADVAVDELIGDGSYINSGTAAVLVAANESSPCLFAGSISGPISFMKTGGGVQALTGVNTYSGCTTVSGGSLVLGDIPVSDVLPVTDDIFRLDASSGVTLVEGDDAKVASWADADGKDIVCANTNYKSLGTPNYATLLSDHVNGLPAVHFDHSYIRLQASGQSCSMRTYFHVAAWGHDGASTANLDGVFGKGAADNGVLVTTSGGTQYSNANTDWVNGESGSKFTKGSFHLFTRLYSSAMDWPGPAVGDYSPHSRPFGGDICEIVGYSRALNATELGMVNDYLMIKWGVKERPATVRRENVLPVGTDLEVAEGSVLFLNAVDQTVRTLSGEGAVSNQTDVVSTLTITDDCTFAGVVGPNVNIVVKAGATLTLAEGAVLDSGIVITAEEGATIDLSGQTFAIKTFRAVSPRQARNGRFVESAPWSRGFMLQFR